MMWEGTEFSFWKGRYSSISEAWCWGKCVEIESVCMFVHACKHQAVLKLVSRCKLWCLGRPAGTTSNPSFGTACWDQPLLPFNLMECQGQGIVERQA